MLLANTPHCILGCQLKSEVDPVILPISRACEQSNFKEVYNVISTLYTLCFKLLCGYIVTCKRNIKELFVLHNQTSYIVFTAIVVADAVKL